MAAESGDSPSDGWQRSSRYQLLEAEKAPNDLMPSEKTTLRRFLTNSFLFHLTLILLYTLVFAQVLKTTTSAPARYTNPYSPAQDALQYRRQLLDSAVYKKSPYSGNPSPEVDQAWNDLMRVSGRILEKINRTSILLSDGSGDYISGLDTTHHLHCLQSIRHFLAPEYYADEVAEAYKPEGEVYPTQIAHCIEILRMIIMCKSDGSLYTHEWDMGKRAPLTNFAVEHECVDWDGLQDWTARNSFRIHGNLLEHPIYGKWPGDGPV